MKEIKLTKGKFAIVDDDMFEYLNQWKWQCNSKGYAVKHIPLHENPKRPTVYMHQFILKVPEGMETDHINYNRLDNRKENLRFCTGSQNQINKPKQRNNISGYKGVCWHKRIGKWQVKINVYGKRINLGYFTEIQDAANAYREAAKRYYGEFFYDERPI